VVSVLDVAPTLTISGNATVDEGATYTLNLSASDPGTDTITEWSIDWGDGNVETVSGNPSTVTHDYANGLSSYTISATATDEDGTYNSNAIVVTFIESTLQTLVEGTDFVVTRSIEFEVPENPSAVQLTFTGLQFDTTDTDDMNDAFELALVDANGQSLVAMIDQDHDAFFNSTEGESVQNGLGVEYNASAGTVTVDISHLAAGTTATLFARLVNNDDDTTTEVTIDTQLAFVESPFTSPSTSVPAGYQGETDNVDDSDLTDVTSIMQVDYTTTSFNDADNQLLTGITLTHAGSYDIYGPVLVGIRNITSPAVSMGNVDGYTAEGMPYYDITHLLSDGTFSPGDSISGLSLTFLNPQEAQFDYDLVVLGHLNVAPNITSDPELEVVAGQAYLYDVHATDHENGTLTYELVYGPDGMTIDSQTGVISWGTTTNEVGTHSIAVKAVDPHGLSDTQSFTLEVTENIPNRPPQFTSSPVIDAYVNSEYLYSSSATDPDGDALSYVLVSGPDGMVNSQTTSLNAVTWIPLENRRVAITNVPAVVSLELDLASGILSGELYYSDEFTVASFEVDYDGDGEGDVVVSATLEDTTFSIQLDSAELALVDTIKVRAIDAFYSAEPLPWTDVDVTGVTFTPTPGFSELEFSSTTRTISGTVDSSLNLYQPFIELDYDFDGVFETVIPVNLVDGTFSYTLDGDLLDASGNVSVRVSSFDNSQGGFSWTPTADDVGKIFQVTLQADDSNGGLSQQMYEIYVHPQEGNHDPVITSEPEETFEVPNQSTNPASGDVDPTEINIAVAPGATDTQTISITLPPVTTGFSTDIVVVVDVSPSMGEELEWLKTMIPDLNNALIDAGITDNRFALVEFLGDANIISNDANDPQVALTLIGPGNTVVDSVSVPLTSVRAAIDQFVLPADGDYKLIVGSPYTNDEYSVVLDRERDESVAVSGLGDFQGSIQAGEEAVITFTAPQGFQLYLDLLEGNTGPLRFQIESPSGESVLLQYLNDSYTYLDQLPVLLSESGTYTLTVRGTSPTDTGNYNVRLSDFSGLTTNLTLNTAVSDSISEPKASKFYRFTGTAGQTVFYDSFDQENLYFEEPGYEYYEVTLISPTGKKVFVNGEYSGDGDQGVFVLPETGDYTLVINSKDTETIDFNFQILDLQTAGSLVSVDSTITGSLDPAAETNVYRFDVTAGDEFTFDLTARSGSGSAYWELIDPYGRSIFNTYMSSASAADQSPGALLSTGTYSLLIKGATANQGDVDYSFEIVTLGSTTPTTPSGDLKSLGEVVQGDMQSNGEQDTYLFNISAGQTVFFDSLEAETSSMSVKLISPSGHEIVSTSFVRDNELINTEYSIEYENPWPVTLWEPGTYQIVIENLNSTPGDYEFRLLDLSIQPELTFESTLSGEFPAEEKQDVYQFSGQRGDRITVKLDAFSDSADFIKKVSTVDTSGTEDGYNGLAGALSLPFREDAAVNVILITDENRDVVNQSLNYNNMLEQLNAIGATLHSMVMLDINAHPDEGSFSHTIDPGLIDASGTVQVRLNDYYEFELDPEWITLADTTLTDVPGFKSISFDEVTGTVSGVFDMSLGYQIPVIEIDYTLNDYTNIYFYPDDVPSALGLTGETTSDAAFFSDNSYNTLSSQAVDASNLLSAEVNGFLEINYDENTHVLSGTLDPGLPWFTPVVYVDYEKDGSPDESVYPNAEYEFSIVLDSGSVPANLDFNVKVADEFDLPWISMMRYEGFDELNLDDQTGVLSGIVDLSQGYTDYLIEIDYDQDGSADASTSANATTGVFSVALNAAQIPSNGSINVRLTDDDTQTLSWETLDASALITFTGVGFDSYYLKNSTATLAGIVDLSLNADLYRIEIDYNSDGVFDPVAIADKYTGEFSLSINPNLLAGNGEFDLRLIAGYGDYYTTIVNENLFYKPLRSYPPHPQSTEADNYGTEEEYVDLAYAAGGTAWSIDQFRGQYGVTTLDETLNAIAFSKAFVSTLTQNIYDQQDLNLVATDPSVEFTILDEQVEDGVATFTVQFTGTTEGHSFDLQFVQQDEPGIVFGSIPTTIQLGYLYDVNALDVDGDTLTYELVGDTHGALINSETGIMTWYPEDTGEYTFTALVTDGNGGQDTQTWTVTVTETGADNVDPVIDDIADITTETDREITIQLTGSDADGDALWFYVVDDTANGAPIPVGMTIDSTTGVVYWNPTEEQEGIYTIKARVLDSFGGIDETSFTITVNEPAEFTNNRPVITSSAPLSALEGVTYLYDLDATDAEGDRLTYELSVAPEGMAIDGDTGMIAWKPTYKQLGYTTVVARVTDALGGVAVQVFELNVTSTNEAPEITPTPIEAAGLDLLWTYQVEASDPNGDILVYRLDQASLDRGMTIDSTGLVSWTATATGDYQVEVTVDDQRGGTATLQFVLPVRNNAAPVFESNPPAPAFVGEVYIYNIVVSDPNLSDTVTLSLDADSLARGMILTGNVLTWTAQHLGDVAVTISADDGQGAVTTQSFTLPVKAPVVVSEPPVITSRPSGPAYAEQPWTYTVTATDVDSDDAALFYSLMSPEQVTGVIEFDTVTHTLTWTPAVGDVGTSQSFTVRVTDSAGSWREQSFTVPAVAVPVQNDPPEITSIPTGPAVVGTSYSYQVTAFDPEGETLTYSVDSASEAVGITIDSTTGLLTWTNPPVAGNQSISITVTDEAANQFIQTFTLPVITLNHGPEITSVPTGPAYIDEAWSYQISASDADDDTLTYSLLSPETLPGNVSFDDQTGILIWTPSTGETELSFTVEVSDGNGGLATQSVTIPAVRHNEAPEITSIPSGPAIEGQLWTYVIDATDPDNDMLTYSLVSPETLPAGVSFDDQTGTISWTPVAAQNPDGLSFTVRVEDGFGGYAEQSFTVPVITAPTSGGGGALPTITSVPEGPIYAGELWTYDVTYNEPDGDPTITFDVQSDVAGEDISIDGNGSLTWTPSVAGRYTITVSIDDNADGVATQTFEVDVVEHNLPPEVTSTPTTNIRVNEYWSYLVQATDPNGDTLTYSLDEDSLTRGMTINATTGRILWTPDTVGSYPVVVTVDDGNGLTATHSFSIAVNNTNPEINSQPTGPAYVGTQWSYQVIATDADGHALQYELLSPGVLPDDMQIDANGLLTWTPTTTDAVDIEIKVSDSVGGYRTQSFTLEVETVVPPNQSPVIESIPVTSVELNQVYQYQIDAYDPNGDDLIYSLNSAPAGMSINDDGLISWSPQTLGEYSVELVVEDPAGLQSTQTFTLIVTAPVVLNEGPEITSTPTGPAIKDRAYQYRAIASDPNGDVITWSLDPASVVGNMAINATTGQLTWTPADDGTYSITVIATDSHGAAASQTFSLVVLKNAAPVITSTPDQSVDINVAYSYEVSASDPNPGDTVTFALTDSPAGATINAETGVLSWTSSTPGLYSFTITATDQDGATGSQTYQLQVIDPVNNNAPVLTSAPRSQVQVDQQFLYQVEAFDSDGDTLSYTLVSGPAGMVLDSKGLLDWTPAGSDVAGSPHTFTILVEDGRGGSVQASYEINVVSEFVNTAPQFTTSPSTNLVVGKTYSYDANGVDADGDTILFRLVNAPDGMTIDTKTGLVQWTPSIDDLGEHTMTVRLVDTYGAGVDQTVTLTVRSVNRPPMITSRPPTQLVINDSYDYTVLANDPDGNTLTYSLGDQTTATGITINSATGEIDWTPTTAGTYRIHVNVFDEYGLGVAQLYDVEVLGAPPNFAPYITTRPAVEAEAGALYTYDVDAFDPNLSDTITFSLVAPDPLLADMTFDTNTGVITWTPDVSLIGQLVQFKVVASDGSLTSTQSYSVRVQPVNELPDVGEIGDITLSAGAYFNYGVYAWDGNADPLTYSLDQASLDRGMTIDSTYGLINWQTDIDDISATPYGVTVTVSDGRGTPVTESFTITVEADQTAPDVTITLLNNSDKIGEELSIQVFATDQVGVTARTLTLYSVTLNETTTVLNQTLAIDANGIARLALTEDMLGTLTFTASAVDAAGNEGTATPVELQVLDPSDQSPPTVTLTSLSYYQEITAPIDILGSVTDDSLDNLTWTLSAIPHDGGATKIIASGIGELTNEVIGRFDPTLLRNGIYTIELEATDAGGNVSFDSEVIKVDGNLKLGNFTVSFTDLEVPVVGIPITVTRTYDTLDSNVQGDFGYGWSMDMSNTKVRIVQPDGSDPGLFGYPIFEDGTRIIITLPDGSEDRFTFRPERQVSGWIKTGDYLPKFIPDLGVKSELRVDARHIRKLGDGYIDMETGRGYSPADPILGGAYALILRNGVELAINAETGDLSTITDLSGNQITFTGMGIESNAGRSIEFERDYAGRITAIIDPAGNRLEYSYDSEGNLISSTDRANTATNYTYLNGIKDPEHYLDEIIDSLGRPVAKNEYDADGRLIRNIDAEGQSVEYDWNANSKIQRITDQLGFTTVITLDDRGNVIQKVDPLGQIIINTYDENNNILSETIVIGEEDSVLNNEENDLSITYKYSEDDDLLSTIDSFGNNTNTTYNKYGQVVTHSDVFGNTSTTYFNSSTGLPDAVQDPLGNKKLYEFDDEGNLSEFRSENGSLLLSGVYNQYGEVLQAKYGSGESDTYFEHDLNGDTIAKWKFEGIGLDKIQILNLTEYDEERRIISFKSVILPYGEYITENLSSALIDPQFIIQSTSKTYDSNGQLSLSLDEDGNTSEYIYDRRGFLIELRKQIQSANDQTAWQITRNVFDAVGNLTAKTDPYLEGTTEPITGTRFIYNSVGQVTKTEKLNGIEIQISGSGSNWQSELVSEGDKLEAYSATYNSAHRLASSTDTNSNTSYYTYNSKGLTTEVRNQVKDQNGQLVWLVSRTIYDEFGRAVISTSPYIEGSGEPIDATRSDYDLHGRQYQTAQLENVNIDLVDGESILISSGIEISTTTTYFNRYGQISQVITSTGAISNLEYDAFGRQTASVGPEVNINGMLIRNRTESVYNAHGRLESVHTNIVQLADGTIDRSNMKVTNYEYDLFGNKIKTIYDNNTFTTAIYDESRNLISQTDTVGNTTTYEYNSRGILVAVNLPMVAAPDNGGIQTNPRYEYTYDELGRQTQIIDPLGNTTLFTYDERGNQLSRTLPDGSIETFTYDDMGRMLTHKSFEGVISGNVYENGVLIEKQFFNDESSYQNGSGTPDESFSYVYDAFGRIFSVTKQSASETRTTITTYDSKGQLVQIDSPEGTVNYEYDQYGRKTRTYTGDPSDPVTDTLYTYDALGRLETVSVVERNDEVLATPETTTYEYDLIGNLDQTILPNGVITDYTYDELNRLETLTHYLTDETPEDLSDNDKIVFEYEVRTDGKRTKETETIYRDENENGQFEANEIKTVTTDWTYDDAGRLIDEVFSHYDELLDQSSHFTYDLTGNRLEQQVEKDFDGDGDIDKKTTTYSYDENDRLLSETTELDDNNDGSIDSTSGTTYSYTGTQQTGKTVSTGGVNQSTTAFTYDLQGRMETVTITTLDGTGTATRIEKTTYDYDARGIRVSALYEVDTDADGIVDETTKTEYLNDPYNFTGYSQVIQETEYDENGVITKRVIYTIGHDQINQTTIDYIVGVPQTPETLFFLADGHGSTRILADTAGAIPNIAGVEQHYFYDAFGNLLNMQATQAATSYLYSGEQYDAKVGQQYLRARYYDATTGRFNRLDPFAGNTNDPQSLHKYLYTHADPINGIDPSGLFSAISMGVASSVRNQISASYVGAITGVAVSLEYFEDNYSVHGAIIEFFWDALMSPVDAAVGFVAAVIDLPFVLMQAGNWLLFGPNNREGDPLANAAAPIPFVGVVSTLPGRHMLSRYNDFRTARNLADRIGVSERFYSVNNQRHHLSQSAVFDRIPQAEGLTIILRGGGVGTHGSEHRTVHDILENDLLDRYRPGGDLHGMPLTVEQYNNAMANALVEIGVEEDELRYIMGMMIMEQKHHGYESHHELETIPDRVVSIARRTARTLKKVKIF
tara:strand:- start:1303 stop:19128 length:17826 start_codon:yes stop_codon:yes gene_type:complete